MPFFFNGKPTKIKVGDELVYDPHEDIIYIMREAEALEFRDREEDALRPRHFNTNGPATAEAVVKVICYMMQGLWFTQRFGALGDDKVFYRFVRRES